MRRIRIVTALVMNRGRLLLLRRSRDVRSMRGLWSAVSGTIEGGEAPLERARTEILEETGIRRDDVRFVRSGDMMVIRAARYGDREWELFPFLFEASHTRVRLNWENSDHAWVRPEQVGEYDTVPDLGRVLGRLL